MPFVRHTDDTGASWAVNFNGVWQIVRENAWLMEAAKGSKQLEIGGKDKRNPADPTIYYVHTNRIDPREVDRSVGRFKKKASKQFVVASASVFEGLVTLREHTVQAHANLRKLQQTASDATKDTVGACLSAGRAARVGQKASELTLDASVTVLAGAVFWTGAAAGGAIALGSLVKGVGTYQETHNVTEATLDCFGTGVVGSLGQAAKIALAGKHARQEARSWSTMRCVTSSATGSKTC